MNTDVQSTGLAHPVSPQAAMAIVRSQSLATLVQEDLERLILSGDLPAGARLNENLIAGRLGISRGPVRESLRTLAEMGLIRFQKNRGAFVRQISAEEAAEIYEVRAALEGVMGRRLAECVTPEGLQELRDRVEEMDKAAETGNVDAYHPLNVRFHERLVEFSGNRKLAAIYRRLINELTLFRRRTLAHGNSIHASNAEHRLIIAAIAAGDPELSQKAMYDHIIASGERMQQALQLYLEGQEPAHGAEVRGRRIGASRRRKTATGDQRGFEDGEDGEGGPSV